MINPTTFNPYNPTGQSSSAPQQNMDMNMFLRLLTVQMSTQNPLEPMNDRDFFAQMAQLGTVQGLDNIRQSMELAQAGGLIGKTVTATRPMTESASGVSDTVTGVVRSVASRNGEYWLTLEQEGGTTVQVRLENVREVTAGPTAN